MKNIGYLFLRMLLTTVVFTITGITVGTTVVFLTVLIKENDIGYALFNADLGVVFGGLGGAILGVLLFYPLREDSLLRCSLFTGGITAFLSLAAGIAGHIGLAFFSIFFSIPISFVMWFGLKAQRMDAEALVNRTLDDKV